MPRDWSLQSSLYSRNRTIKNDRLGRRYRVINLESNLILKKEDYRHCLVCEKVMPPEKHSNAKYCSSKCNSAFHSRAVMTEKMLKGEKIANRGIKNPFL